MASTLNCSKWMESCIDVYKLFIQWKIDLLRVHSKWDFEVNVGRGVVAQRFRDNEIKRFFSSISVDCILLSIEWRESFQTLPDSYFSAKNLTQSTKDQPPIHKLPYIYILISSHSIWHTYTHTHLSLSLCVCFSSLTLPLIYFCRFFFKIYIHRRTSKTFSAQLCVCVYVRLCSVCLCLFTFSFDYGFVAAQ